MKFLSHHDMMRLFARAVIRAGFPVRCSQGFSPRPRLRLPLPRPVGIGSEVERLIVDLDQTVSETEFQDRLQEQVPKGIELQSTQYMQDSDKGLPVRVTYRLHCPGIPSEKLETAWKAFQALDTCEITRTSGPGKPSRRIDIRPFVENAIWQNDCVEVEIQVTGEGTARPAEVLAALGFETDNAELQIHRIGIDWT